MQIFVALADLNFCPLHLGCPYTYVSVHGRGSYPRTTKDIWSRTKDLKDLKGGFLPFPLLLLIPLCARAKYQKRRRSNECVWTIALRLLVLYLFMHTRCAAAMTTLYLKEKNRPKEWNRIALWCDTFAFIILVYVPHNLCPLSPYRFVLTAGAHIEYNHLVLYCITLW